MSSEPVETPLKPLDQLCSQDGRQALFTVTLPQIHADLAAIELKRSVPREVRSLFETAKNVSLYSWYVYPFHQVAELTAFTALEYALRIRANVPQNEEYPPGLGKLLQQAQREGWFSNEAFTVRREMGLNRARERKSLDALRAFQHPENAGLSSVEVEEPTPEEIAEATASVDVVKVLVEITPKLRNTLAHGSKTLHPGSRWTLKFLAEAINQLFPQSR